MVVFIYTALVLFDLSYRALLMMDSEDLMKSVIILMQGGIGDTVRLYSILLALRKKEPLSISDQQYLQDLIEKHLDREKSESSDN